MTAQEKSDIHDMLENTPEEMTVQEFLEEAQILMKSMEGLAQWERGECVSFEEAQESVKKWMS